MINNTKALPFTLSGDDNIPAMPMTDAQVNHLRRLLAWMRCEWMLDEHSQRGCVRGALECVRHGVASEERAVEILNEQAEKTARCPAYVRQAVKILTKALADHEMTAGVIDHENPSTETQPTDDSAAGERLINRIIGRQHREANER